MADKNPFPGENNTGHIWDDNIRELRNPIPRWWMMAFWASMAWFVGYAILYPMFPVGDEPTEGVMGWTQISEYKQAVAEVDALRAPFEDKISGMTAKEVLEDEGLSGYVVASSKVLFGDNCAGCHGAGGQGGPGFPVLADDDWLFGGSIETIVQTITNGRRGMMISHSRSLSKDEIDSLASFVVDLSEGKDDPAGRKLYQEKGCFGCHGMDAKGLQIMGSVNLTDAVWRFNESDKLAAATYTITHGINDPSDPMTREAQMPAFGSRLSADDIKKLAVYVYKLGGGQ